VAKLGAPFFYEAVEDPGETEVQSLGERRTVRDREARQEPLGLLRGRVEVVGLVEAAPDPVRLHRPDANVHGAARAQKAMQDARGVVAQHDGIANARSPPEIAAAPAERHGADVESHLGLARMDRAYTRFTEALRQVDTPPRVRLSGHARDRYRCK